MKTAHKIRMNPTPEQVEYLKRACGTRRFIYNWGREQWEKQYQAYKLERETVPEEQRVLKPPSALALKKQFHAIRETAAQGGITRPAGTSPLTGVLRKRYTQSEAYKDA